MAWVVSPEVTRRHQRRSVLSRRIAGEMIEAFVAANAAVRRLAPAESRYGPNKDLHEVGLCEPLTTIAVTAWTPDNGHSIVRVGDSMVFLVPVAHSRGWHGSPGQVASGNRVIGEFAMNDGSSPPPSLILAMQRLSDDLSAADIGSVMEPRGMFIILITDGAHTPYMGARTGAWFIDNNSLGFAIPPGKRTSALNSDETQAQARYRVP